jgi:hypothetical protein
MGHNVYVFCNFRITQVKEIETDNNPISGLVYNCFIGGCSNGWIILCAVACGRIKMLRINEKSELSSCIIEVDGGKIIGTISSDSEVLIYKGIPYAAPPVGDLRWKTPQHVIPWSGIKECDTFEPSAIQPTQASFFMWSTEFIIDTSLGCSEDCLTLNIWRKRPFSEKRLPVIVYIHGGGFTSGG